MDDFMMLAIMFIVMFVLFYLLWINGYMLLNMKRALLFVGSLRGENKCQITFSSCSGYVKKVIKLKENRSYHFNLSCNVPNGNISVFIENKNKEVLLNLTPVTKTGTLTVHGKSRYYLVLKFEKADGEYTLEWN